MAKQFQIDTGGTLTTGLMSYFKLDNVNDFWNAYNLTNGNSTAFATGKVGNGADFESSSSNYLRIADNLGITGGAFSASLWVKFESNTGADQTLFFKSDATNFVEYLLQLESFNTLKFYRQKAGGAFLSNTVSVSWTPTTGVWYHIVCTNNGSESRVYIDTVDSGNVATSGNGTSTAVNQLNIGGWARGVPTQNWVDGTIDELGIWDKALNATERGDLYNAGSGQTMVSVATQMLTETPTITATASKTTQRPLTQTLSLTGTILRAVTRAFAEIHTIGNALTSLKIITANMTLEAVALTQSFLRSISRTITETATVAGSVLKLTARLFSNTVTSADTLRKQAGKVLSDALAAADATFRSLTRTAIESVTLADTHLKQTLRSISESLTLTELFARGLTYARTFLETLTLKQFIRTYLNGLSTRYAQKYPTRGASYTGKYSARGSSYEEKYPSP